MSAIKDALLSKLQMLMRGVESKLRTDAIEYHLKQSAAHHPLALRAGEKSEVIAFIQSALTQLGYTPGPVDGVFAPKLAAALNAYIPAKKSESVSVTEFVEGGHTALTPVGAITDITAHHVAALADSLNDAGKMGFDKPDSLRAYCAALKQIPDETIAAIARDLEAELNKQA
jgi:peptidoglycan hydrolase-like protein with peptidoglycan-binding domain